jgi:hypothetical protein
LAALSILGEIGWSIALFLIAILAGAMGCLMGCAFGLIFKEVLGPFSFLLAVICGLIFGIEFAKYTVSDLARHFGIGHYMDSLEGLGAFGGVIGAVLGFIFLAMLMSVHE